MTPPLSARRFAGRPRVVAWITAVTAVGLLLLILAVSIALRATMNDGISDGIAQEAGEIQRFAETGLDPATGQPFDDTLRFIEVYLERQQPERAELLIGGSLGAPPAAEVRGAEAAGFGDLDPDSRARVLEAGSAGVPESERALIIRPFVRASNDPHPGVGLGLTVAERLTRAMGGSLELLDSPDDGQGLVVRVEIPRGI